MLRLGPWAAGALRGAARAPALGAARARSRQAQAQARSLFIQTLETPNPDSLKYLPGKAVLPSELGTSMNFSQGDPARNAPLAALLLRVRGVKGVMLGEDFVTVSKEEAVSWEVLKPEIFAGIMDFYAAGKPAVTGPLADGAAGDQFSSDGKDSEIVMLIKELLVERIRPMVQEDGGDIFFKGYDEDSGVVKVQLAGSCSGCPSSSVTLKSGVENMLKHYIPEITSVEAVTGDPDARKLTFNTGE